MLIVIVFQLPSCVWLFATPRTAAFQAPVSYTIFWSFLCPLGHWFYLTISSSAAPFSCPQSLPASETSPMSELLSSGGQSIGISASASVLPMNIQGWFPLGLTGLISLLSKGLSRVFSSTTIWKHQFYGAQPFFGASGKEPTCQCRGCKRCRFDSWVGKIPWRRAWQRTPEFLPEEFHGQRNLVGYSPWVTKSGTWLSTHTHLSLYI